MGYAPPGESWYFLLPLAVQNPAVVKVMFDLFLSLPEHLSSGISAPQENLDILPLPQQFNIPQW